MTHNDKGVLSAKLYELKFYIVCNAEGKFYRSKGLHGYGRSWTEDVKKAKVYSRIGPARSVVTYWAGHYPEYGIPDLVEFGPGTINVITEDERVKKSIKKKWEKIRERERDNIVRRIENLVRQGIQGTAEVRRLQDLLSEIDNKNQ